MNYNEIKQIPDITTRIAEIQKHTAEVPPAIELYKNWNPECHRVLDEKFRPKQKIMKKEGQRLPDGRETDPQFEYEEVNRITLPIEQDIVNIHTAFTVGIEPKISIESQDKTQKKLYEAIKLLSGKEKLKYKNKQIVRSWLSECQVCEYWYLDNDFNYWDKVVESGTKPTKYPRVKIFSPFLGDRLYPVFDDFDNLQAMGRYYKIKDNGNSDEREFFMIIDAQKVEVYQLTSTWTLIPEQSFFHNLGEVPVIYMDRKYSLTKPIKRIRERLEDLYSNFADAIDRCFFPYLILEGEIEGAPKKVGNNRMIKITDSGKAYYLDWQQTPEMIRLEMENLTGLAYSLTNTPRISFENLKGMGQQSGIAFKYTFMGTHMAVENHAEEVSVYLKRRYGLLSRMLGSLYPDFKKASQSIDIMVEIVPYMIENLQERISTAVSALSGNVASSKTAVIMAGLVDNWEDEIKLINEGQKIPETKIPPTTEE